MIQEHLAEIAALARAVVPTHAALLDRARALGALVAVEVLDLRPGADGVWELRIRPLASAVYGVPEPGLPAVADRAPCHPPDPPFTSPVRVSVPFHGDGSTEISRFIAEADPVVRVPARGGGPVGELVRLSDDERLRMLPGTIAGDALLSLQHQGLHNDPAAVEQALRCGREHFAAEVSRSGTRVPAEDFLRLYDGAAAVARKLLPEA